MGTLGSDFVPLFATVFSCLSLSTLGVRWGESELRAQACALGESVALLSAGALVGCVGGLPGLGGACRITVGGLAGNAGCWEGLELTLGSPAPANQGGPVQ